MTKDERKAIAISHKKLMDRLYYINTKESIDNSKVYINEQLIPITNNNEIPSIIVEPITSEQAVYKYSNGSKSALLNFASFKHPGGGFINGAIAQEEAICHASNLYNIISDSKFYNYYEYNRNHLNDGLYANFAIYSPDIIFPTDDELYKIDVITCAAPNKNAYMKCHANEYAPVNLVMESRIKFILNIAETNKVDTLILGAFGCGVFGNDPYAVANIFKKYICNGNYSFKNVIFAIPPSGVNYNTFLSVFK